MRSVHERVLAVDAAQLAPLLDGIGGPDDQLWPFPLYGAQLRLHGDVAVGVTGMNGPVEVQVTAYEPGRRLELTSAPGSALDGTFSWEIESLGPGRALVRQCSQGHLNGVLRWLWPLVRKQHDHCMEAMLDRADAFVGIPSAPLAEPWASRMLARLVDAERAQAATVPKTELLRTALDRVDYADAYAITARPGMPTDPQVWADALFRDPPAVVSAGMWVRDRVVRLVGIAPSGDTTFATVARTDDEVLLGSDENHLDFRASVWCAGDRVVLTTVVSAHNARGRAYFWPVRFVHPLLVRAMLTRAAHRLSRAKPSHHSPYGLGHTHRLRRIRGVVWHLR